MNPEYPTQAEIREAWTPIEERARRWRYRYAYGAEHEEFLHLAASYRQGGWHALGAGRYWRRGKKRSK